MWYEAREVGSCLRGVVYDESILTLKAKLQHGGMLNEVEETKENETEKYLELIYNYYDVVVLN